MVIVLPVHVVNQASINVFNFIVRGNLLLIKSFNIILPYVCCYNEKNIYTNEYERSILVAYKF